MADKRLVVTERGLCWVPEGDDGIPVGEVFPAEKVPAQLEGARFFETPQGYVLGKPLEGANDKGRKPWFLLRQEQIQKHDAEFHARLEQAYDKVKVTAQPMRLFGQFRSDIERPDVAADEVRIRLMRHFPEGPGMAAIAQQAAKRYAKALQTWLEKEGERRPKPSELARRWGMSRHEHGNAELEYYGAGYRPAMVDPYAIDFSQVKLTGRERKAAWKDRSAGRERDGDRER